MPVRTAARRVMELIMTFVFRLIAAAAIAATPVIANAGDVLLTLTGHGEPREYDRAALVAMDATSFTTTTIWTEGEQQFIGVSLKAFVDEAGITEGTLQARAINDYAVEIPVSDAVEGGPIIAYSLNGAAMSVRDKGPLWVVYPYDLNPDYQSEVTYSRSVWQLDRIELLD